MRTLDGFDEPDAALPDDVAQLRDQIAERYDPEAIILFGSNATSNARPDSDIDLLIIKRTTEPYFDRIIELRRSIDTSRRVDAIVLTPQEYDKAIKENRYFLVKEILPKGQTIYERPRARHRRSRVA
jgi:predicted nucleotidyltransferase